MDNSSDFYNLIVFFSGFFLGNKLESALKQKRKIDEWCVLFISGISVAIFAWHEQGNNLANVFLTLFVGCRFLLQEKKIYPAMAIGFMIAAVICLIYKGNPSNYVAFALVIMSLCALKYKETIDFVYNRIRFDSNDFNRISNFIYNKLIRTGK